MTDGVDITLAEGPRPPKVWGDLLTSTARVSFFHEELWTRVIATHLPNFSGQWLIARLDGQPVGGLALIRRERGALRSWEGHHAGTPGWPVIRSDVSGDSRDRILDALVEAAAALGRGSRSLGLVLSLPPEWDERLGPSLKRHGFRRTGVPSAVLPLAGGIDHVEMNVFKGNRRNERNRAFKAGCLATCREGSEELKEFHVIYRDACTRWDVDPVPEEMCRDLLDDGSGKVFQISVHNEGRLIGAHLCLRDGDVVTAWIGATDPAARQLFPATVIVWTELQEACRRGAAWLDLGGHGGLSGVANFKKLLGAETIERGCWDLTPRPVRLARGLVERFGRRSGS